MTTSSNTPPARSSPAEGAAEYGLIDEVADMDRAIELASELGQVPPKVIYARPRRPLFQKLFARIGSSFAEEIAESHRIPPRRLRTLPLTPCPLSGHRGLIFGGGFRSPCRRSAEAEAESKGLKSGMGWDGPPIFIPAEAG